jgi:ATP synthase F1 delta subunit
LKKSQIARRYSRAIVDTVDDAAVPSVIGEMTAFADLLDRNRQLKLLFAGKIFSDEERVQAFDAVSPELKFSEHTARFLRLIIVNGHMAAIRETIESLINLYNEKKKRAKAIVVSPVEMSEAHAERLKAALKNMTRKEVEIENEVDPSLLGGFIVRVGSNIYDSSLKGQLRMLRSELMR